MELVTSSPREMHHIIVAAITIMELHSIMGIIATTISIQTAFWAQQMRSWIQTSVLWHSHLSVHIIKLAFRTVNSRIVHKLVRKSKITLDQLSNRLLPKAVKLTSDSAAISIAFKLELEGTIITAIAYRA